VKWWKRATVDPVETITEYRKASWKQNYIKNLPHKRIFERRYDILVYIKIGLKWICAPFCTDCNEDRLMLYEAKSSTINSCLKFALIIYWSINSLSLSKYRWINLRPMPTWNSIQENINWFFFIISVIQCTSLQLGKKTFEKERNMKIIKMFDERKCRFYKRLHKQFFFPCVTESFIGWM
jgi:hypothetical protein